MGCGSCHKIQHHWWAWTRKSRRLQQMCTAYHPSRRPSNIFMQLWAFLEKILGWRQSKNGNYVSWPGLTVEVVNKHFPESIETQQGHMKKKRQYVRSTMQKLIIKDTSKDGELTRAVTKCKNILVKVVNAHNTVYSNQTGRLPVQSNRGNWFLMVGVPTVKRTTR